MQQAVLTLWDQKLVHPNVIGLYAGACYNREDANDPWLLMTEFAPLGNLTAFVARHEVRWQLFYQAAKGLAHLHENNVVHGALKCSNVLVAGTPSEPTAKLSDFGFHQIRELPVSHTQNEQSGGGASYIRWTAPECFLATGGGGIATLDLNVYSLGMSIVEAKTGDLIWGEKYLSGQQINDHLASEESCYLRPAHVFLDKEWNLMQTMTRSNPNERVSLKDALAALAADEQHRETLWPKRYYPHFIDGDSWPTRSVEN